MKLCASCPRTRRRPQVHEAVLAAHADDDLDMDPTLRACVQRSLVGPHLASAAEPVAPPPLTLSAFGMHLARLCALVPPPNFHMVRYFGVIASHHHLRPRVVPGPGAELPDQQLPLLSPVRIRGVAPVCDAGA